MPKVDIKVVLLGASDVGKTSLVERYLHGSFNNNTQMTVGAAFGAKSISIGGGKSVTLGVWDTAGTERYESMSRMYYRGAQAAIVCYDISNDKSWERVKMWVNELKANEGGCHLFIVSTKLDLVLEGKASRNLPEKEVEKYARQIGAQTFETSAKTGMNVNELFEAIARVFVERPPQPTATGREYSPVIALAAEGQHHPRTSCCK